MIIGIPKEIKSNENRVGLTPGGTESLVKNGHSVFVEKGAGSGSGFEDEQYVNAGAVLFGEKEEIFKRAELIVKVKEPQACEYSLLRPGQILYAFLHLAPNRPLVEALIDKKVTAIAYESVQLATGYLPLLAPMSEVAGRLSVQIGANLLQKHHGGMGILLGGIPGVSKARVVIIGGGVVGTNAAKIALGLGADVIVLDTVRQRLGYLDDIFSGRITTLISNQSNLAQAVESADLLISAVLVSGALAPKIVKEEMVKTMKKGAVIVDVAIDQGGSIETIDRATTHDQPSYQKHGVVHCAIANMPGAVPRTSTIALESVTLPYLLKIADKGLGKALSEDPSLLAGLNTYDGKITCKPLAESLGLRYVNPGILIKLEK